MQLTFLLLALLTLTSAVAAVVVRRLVHSVLCLTVTFAALAALYLQLGAQFIGFAQVLIYVGAVAILIVFALLLTREHESETLVASWLTGVSIAGLVFGCLALCILSSAIPRSAPPAPTASVRHIGEQLMGPCVLPLEVAGLLLTAALLGAVLLAMPEGKANEGKAEGRRQKAESAPPQHSTSI